MDQTDPKWYLLGVIVLVLFAILIPRWFHGPAFSDKQTHQICSDIFVKYSTLVESDASNEQWEALESEALPQLEAIAADHESNFKQRTRGGELIYQIAKYRLPLAIQQRGNLMNNQSPDLIIEELVRVEKIMTAPPKAVRQPIKANQETSQGWDPLIVAILVGDMILAVAGGGYWLWRH